MEKKKCSKFIIPEKELLEALEITGKIDTLYFASIKRNIEITVDENQG
jgi:hypothetical protein